MSPLNVKRQHQVIERDVSRVILRLLVYGENPPRVKRIVQRVLQLGDEESEELLHQIIEKFSARHKDIRKVFHQHYEKVKTFFPSGKHSSLDSHCKLLIGAFFTMEYAIESAALFNPSIVPHPDQSNLEEGCKRIIMSLRAVGEGHISSMIFRKGILDENGDLTLEPESSFVKTPDIINPIYERHLFRLKLDEMNKNNEVTEHILSQLPEKFSFEELKQEINYLSENPQFPDDKQMLSFHHMQRLADSNYQLQFQADSELSERVIFPVSEEESGGIEDARFVQFHDENGETIYYGTYTAYDGMSIMPQMIETRDFKHFKIRTLNGQAVRDKGMALFPRKINGQYVMLSRQDGENNHIMFSDQVHFWQQSRVIQRPSKPWEFIQLGNCGSPIETEHGWLVLTHGVGPVRTYSIGAILLDLEDPSKVIGWLEEPMIKPQKDEDIGYVPNVVYTCGAILHHDRLIIPYSVSDMEPALASVDVDELISAMKKL